MGIDNVLHRKKIQKLILSSREDSLTLLSVILEQPLIVAIVSLMPAIMAPLLEGSNPDPILTLSELSLTITFTLT